MSMSMLSLPLLLLLLLSIPLIFDIIVTILSNPSSGFYKISYPEARQIGILPHLRRFFFSRLQKILGLMIFCRMESETNWEGCLGWKHVGWVPFRLIGRMGISLEHFVWELDLERYEGCSLKIREVHSKCSMGSMPRELISGTNLSTHS
ncbi:uncharacterized protein MYCFIDRAFT_206916 [Pseudocercospora fijiensis CIRAD86]|uniref:Uncharacterized protein n=1 Tax=Pseudocercospora fijiensis (strain CIRAD86) TaxID=383855 RepID=M3AQ36_PSEFD|nr:uncharacterized protein MYCFIDRAFT_206916 [Pseudocercospora fijiensis CIRAD86]EME86711.1 hypothetical protein MYCFIDRAFT_206916 [Pseudocercospora fijiensis CIRAD86]